MQLSRTSISFTSLTFAFFLSIACSSDPEVGDSDQGNGDNSGSDSDGDGNGGDSDGDGLAGDDDGSDSDGNGGGTRPGNGKPEICNGIDDNDDGLIDNVDADNDGVCDCLKIATIGTKGQWGDGDVFNNWLDGKSTAGVVDLGHQTLTPELLAPFDLIVAQNLSKVPKPNAGSPHDLDDARQYTAAEIKALNDWIKAGGGFMTLIGYGDSSERANVNALLAATGLSYESGAAFNKSGQYTLPIVDWHADHKISNRIKAIGTDNGYPVAGDGTVIARHSNKIVAQAKQIEDGRVFVWGDEWISYNSEWEQDEDAPVVYQVERFWLNSIQWLGPQDSCQVPIPPTVR